MPGHIGQPFLPRRVVGRAERKLQGAGRQRAAMVLLNEQGESVLEGRANDGSPDTGVARIAPGVGADACRLVSGIQGPLEAGRRRVLGHTAEVIERLMETVLLVLRERAGRLGDK